MREQHTGDPIQRLFDFVENAPADETLINMDCNDCCEKITQLAEQVANGADLNEIWPEMQKFMRYWGDCREEFEALVAVLRQEQALDGFDFSVLES
ncbi:MAG: hypothetical protein OXE95_06645 [Chloroflexi bacterium]|nr:hypothetical protein [Chloroflexota bacterium]MCY4247237.1 hypothetical protein [Chloroflexota bacterium]